ncbi:Y-family DNA polymerase [Devosia submarina]|uniref:Y-family DNA polymerase n=1 Tax=Devosia submarina TaxID=1173082 RepID=UPI000D3BABBB|nr:DNA polymerase Y family protein [Devosia submarina]
MTDSVGERRFLALFLPNWPTDYLKRHDPSLSGPLVLFEKIKGGLRLVAVDPEASRAGLRIGQTLAVARAMLPELTAREIDRPLLEAGFADLADWHSNASPLVAVMTDWQAFGDLVLDITGVAHLFGGEGPMLRTLLTRLRELGYSVAGAIAPTIGAAWAVSHFARSQIVQNRDLAPILDSLPVAALRLDEKQIAGLSQMGLTSIGQLRERPRKPLQARFGLSLLLRLDQAYGIIQERMSPRLPPAEHYAERRFADPIGLMDDVLMACQDLAVRLAGMLEAEGQGGQAFHLFLYRVDHKVMSLSVNSARLTRDPHHITALFSHRAERLAGEYDAGFGIDMIRLAVSSVAPLDPVQLGTFSHGEAAEDLDQLNDRMTSRLGTMAVLKTELIASHIPERAARLAPALAAHHEPRQDWPRPLRPLRLLPVPEIVTINAEVPDGLPASMIWRRESYRIVKAAGPERLGAEWWRSGQRLQLVESDEDGEPASGEPLVPRVHVPDLAPFEADRALRDYYIVEDAHGHRFWVYRQGMHRPGEPARWYLHGFFS